MKKQWFSISMIIALLALLAFSIQGCGGGSEGGYTPDPGGGGGNDSQIITQMIEGNSSGMFDFEDVSTGETDLDKIEKIIEASPHQRWLRVVTGSSNELEVNVVNNDATARITCGAQGRFFVIPQIGGVLTEKPLDDILTRTARFKKVDGTWQVSSISPIILKPANGAPKVNITSMKVYKGDTLVLTITDPTAEIPVGDLPVFTPNSQVTVEVTVSHPDVSDYSPDSYVFIHHSRRSIDGYHYRVIANQVMNTHTYTCTFNAGNASSIWKPGAADALDAACLHTTDNDYSSNVWIIPYKVSE